MKGLYSLFFFFFLYTGSGQSLEAIRKEFHKAVLDPEESDTFYGYLLNVQSADPTIKAYKAVSEAMLAQVLWNPFSKFSQVRKYSRQMEMAVMEDTENLEIRFLRLAIEYNLPRFLGMSSHLYEDRDMILENIIAVDSYNLDPAFCHYILYFMNDTGLCSKTQFETLKKELKSLEG